MSRPQFAVADNQDPGFGPEMDLCQNFQGRRQGFGKDRKSVGHITRHRMQIGQGQGDELGQTAGFIPEAQDPAGRAMAAQPLSAPLSSGRSRC